MSGICLAADLTIGDLSGSQVISLRAVPLVNVTLDFPNPDREVDLASNQRCQIQSTSLIWYVGRVMTENNCDDSNSLLHALAYRKDATQGTGEWRGEKKGLQLQWNTSANFDGD